MRRLSTSPGAPPPPVNGDRRGGEEGDGRRHVGRCVDRLETLLNAAQCGAGGIYAPTAAGIREPDIFSRLEISRRDEISK